MATGAEGARRQRRKPQRLAKLSNYALVGRTRLMAQFQQKATQLAATSDYPKLSAFLPQNLWPWVWNYIKSVFRGKVKPFPTYPPGTTGVYQLQARAGESKIKIAMAGDWGTGTQVSDTVARSIVNENPDYTIHLGDVYYVGDTNEINENCLDQPVNDYIPVNWPRDCQGSFALNGNHEMYCGGGPYFTLFLKNLGIKNPREQQRTSYFCLETAFWRILAIDTGYNSVGIPILGAIPWINRLSFVGADCRLEDALINWVRDIVQPNTNIKPTLLLSHHQYYTAFRDQSYARPAKQLLEFFPNQKLIWMWGHEHRLAIYDLYSLDGGIKVYGRCLGHGGMPVDVSTSDNFKLSKAPLLLYDSATHKLDDGTEVGRNGFVVLTLDGSALTFDYRDLDSQSLFIERFVGAPDGTVQYACEPLPAGGLTRI